MHDTLARTLALKALNEGGGVSDYADLTNKPQINSVELSGNKSLSDLGIQGTLTAGSNVTINNGTISATDTTYTAGTNITITNGEISATDTTYTAGANISIVNGEISATDTTYTAGTGIDITGGVISATGGGGASYTAGTGIDITNDVISCTYSAGTATQGDTNPCLVTPDDMYNWDNKLDGTVYADPSDISAGSTQFSGYGTQMDMTLEQNDMMTGEANYHTLTFTQNSTEVAKLSTSHLVQDQMTMAAQDTNAEITMQNTTNSEYGNEEHTILFSSAAYAEEWDEEEQMPVTVLNDTKQVTLTPRSFAVDGNEIATQAYVDSAIGGAIGGSY